MDTPKPPKSDHLLDDLESIRRLLEEQQLDPPLLTDSLDGELQIPLLSDIIEPGPAVSLPKSPASAPPAQPEPVAAAPAPPMRAHPFAAPVTHAIPVATPAATVKQPPSTAATTARSPIGSAVRRNFGTQSRAESNRLDGELRAAAQLLLQEVIDDFVPQIEAELKRRLAHLLPN